MYSFSLVRCLGVLIADKAWGSAAVRRQAVLFNKERAEQYLTRYGLDALVLSLPVSVAYATEHQSSFETGFSNYMIFLGGRGGRFFRSFAVVSPRGERSLVVHTSLAATSYAGWTEGLEVYGGAGFDPQLVETVPQEMRPLARRLASSTAERDPMEAVAAAVAALAPGARRVGIEHVGLEPGDFEKLKRAVPQSVELLDASMLTRLIRMVKTDDEIERSARAAEITELGLNALTNVAAPGVSVRELADVFRSVIGPNKADLEHVAVGPRGLGIATPGPHVLRSDDVMMLDVGCLYRGCISDTGVTMALSPPGPQVEEEYATLLTCLETGAEKLRPGQHVFDVYKGMRAVVDGTAVADSQPQGHGLGQEPKELPFISAVDGQRLVDACVDLDADVALEEGMVINLELPLEVPGKRWFQIEQTFVIRSGGAEPITAQDRSRIIIAGGGRGDGGQPELRTT